MSRPQVAPDPSVVRLQEERYDVEITHGHLIVHDVSYVAPDKSIKDGKLIMPYKSGLLSDHRSYFVGQVPCDSKGQRLNHLVNNTSSTQHFSGCTSQMMFSNTPKPAPRGWPGDYHTLVTHYVQMISTHVQVIDPSFSAIPRERRALEVESEVHVYMNDAPARDKVYANAELIDMKIAIVGVGGTGSYILDILAKTFAPEIHLFDGKPLVERTAFRAPGAPTKERVEAGVNKATHYQEVYSNIHKGIVAHPYDLDASNVAQLSEMGFVFVCVDTGQGRRVITDHLLSDRVMFIDIGMGMHQYGDGPALGGTCRVTIGNPDDSERTKSLLCIPDETPEDIYKTNVQIAEMNMINAALAVIEFKRFVGGYPSLTEHDEVLFVVEEMALHREKTCLG